MNHNADTLRANPRIRLIGFSKPLFLFLLLTAFLVITSSKAAAMGIMLPKDKSLVAYYA